MKNLYLPNNTSYLGLTVRPIQFVYHNRLFGAEIKWLNFKPKHHLSASFDVNYPNKILQDDNYTDDTYAFVFTQTNRLKHFYRNIELGYSWEFRSKEKNKGNLRSYFYNFKNRKDTPKLTSHTTISLLGGYSFTNFTKVYARSSNIFYLNSTIVNTEYYPELLGKERAFLFVNNYHSFIFGMKWTNDMDVSIKKEGEKKLRIHRQKTKYFKVLVAPFYKFKEVSFNNFFYIDGQLKIESSTGSNYFQNLIRNRFEYFPVGAIIGSERTGFFNIPITLSTELGLIPTFTAYHSLDKVRDMLFFKIGLYYKFRIKNY